jgi:hypothetical protein
MSRRDRRHLARTYLDLYWLYTAQNKTAREQAEKAFSSQYVEAIGMPNFNSPGLVSSLRSFFLPYLYSSSVFVFWFAVAAC